MDERTLPLRSNLPSALAILLLFVSVLAVSGTTFGAPSTPPTPQAALEVSPEHATALPAGGVAGSPYALRWLSPTSQVVLGLDNGYRTDMGQMFTIGTAGYFCYVNATGSIATPANLYVVSNASGSWQAYKAGLSLQAAPSGGGFHSCAMTWAVWNGKNVLFIAYLSSQNDSATGQREAGVELNYDPTGSLAGPWVNVTVAPFFVQGVGFEPDAPTITIYQNTTVIVGSTGWPSIGTNNANSVVYTFGLPLSALPATEGGLQTQPWALTEPDGNDGCSVCSGTAVWGYAPQLGAAANSLQLLFCRLAPVVLGGPQVPEVAYYQGTVLGNGSVDWASHTGGGRADVVAGFPPQSSSCLIGGSSMVTAPSGMSYWVFVNESAATTGTEDLEYMVAGTGITWWNQSLGAYNAGTSVYDSPSVALDACGVSAGDDGWEATPYVDTYSYTGSWYSQAVGSMNASNELPNFVDVAGQGQYLDSIFLNSPQGGITGWTLFYTNQAVCTDSTLNSVSIVPSSPQAAVDTSTMVDSAALNEAGAPLYASNGVAYSWTLRPSTLGTLNGSTSTVVAQDVNFTAGSSQGTGTLFLNASQDGWIVHTTATITVGKQLTILSFRTSQNNVSTNTAVTLTVDASGGIGAYSYTYTGLPPGCLTANSDVLTCTPTASGSYTIRVYVNGSGGQSASAVTLFMVTPSSSPSGGAQPPYLDLAAIVVVVAVCAVAYALYRRAARGRRVKVESPPASGTSPPSTPPPPENPPPPPD